LIDDNEILTNKALTQILKDYNVEQMISARTPAGTNCLVSTYGMVKSDQYMDPNAEKVFEFDHIKRVFGKEIEGVEQKLDDKIASLRKAVQKEMDLYLKEKYMAGKAVCVVYANNETKNLSICIHASNTKISAFWTGGWNSVFVFNVEGSKDVELNGNIKIHVHYFEDGNVQLHAEVNKTAMIQVKDDDGTAQQVRTAISNIESNYQSHLEQMYIEMHRSTFKNIRRGLPINGQVMNWNIAAHGVGRSNN